MGKSLPEAADSAISTGQESVSAYFLTLSVRGVRCFSQTQNVDLRGKSGEHAKWTVILGEDGTGKSTLLQCLAALAPEPVFIRKPDEHGDGFITEWGRSSGPAFLESPKPWMEWLFSLNDLSFEYTFSDALNKIHKHNVYFSVGSCHFISSYTDVPVKCSIFGYGASRTYGSTLLSEDDEQSPVKSLFDESVPLLNPSEWLLQTDYASRQEGSQQALSAARLSQVRDALTAVLPDVDDIRISPPTETRKTARAEFHTPYGWVPLSGLGLGYRTMTAWMVDLASRLFDEYPDSPDPLAEPAVVLVDEIDLHMHPRWQRMIIDYLSERFPKVQFIVTAHSPLIVQSARDANVVVLRRVENPDGDDYVVIDNDPEIVANWRVDQILTSLFDLETARPKNIEPLLTERRRILAQPELTDADKKRLRKLNSEIGALPTGETPEDLEAMDIIRRAAALLDPDDEA